MLITAAALRKRSDRLSHCVRPSPGIFLNGAGQAAALNQDGGVNSPQNPKPGSIVTIYATGGEPLNIWLDGEIVPVSRPVLETRPLRCSAVRNSIRRAACNRSKLSTPVTPPDW